jgi:MtN3 and saliva related transmembrane protein
MALPCRPKEKPAKSLRLPLAASWPVVTRSSLCAKRTRARPVPPLAETGVRRTSGNNPSSPKFAQTGSQAGTRMYTLETVIGLLAAFCTTVANVPQVKKTWQTKRADDLSLKMLVLLMTGVGLWVVYGLFKSDVVIIFANGATLALLGIILYFKLRYPHDANEHEKQLEVTRSEHSEDVTWQRSA